MDEEHDYFDAAEDHGLAETGDGVSAANRASSSPERAASATGKKLSLVSTEETVDTNPGSIAGPHMVSVRSPSEELLVLTSSTSSLPPNPPISTPQELGRHLPQLALRHNYSPVVSPPASAPPPPPAPASPAASPPEFFAYRYDPTPEKQTHNPSIALPPLLDERCNPETALPPLPPQQQPQSQPETPFSYHSTSHHHHSDDHAFTSPQPSPLPNHHHHRDDPSFFTAESTERKLPEMLETGLIPPATSARAQDVMPLQIPDLTPLGTITTPSGQSSPLERVHSHSYQHSENFDHSVPQPTFAQLPSDASSQARTIDSSMKYAYHQSGQSGSAAFTVTYADEENARVLPNAYQTPPPRRDSQWSVADSAHSYNGTSVSRSSRGDSTVRPNVGLSNSYEYSLWGMAPHELLQFVQQLDIFASAGCIVVATFGWLGHLLFLQLDKVVLLAYLAAMALVLLVVDVMAMSLPEHQRLIPSNWMGRIRDQLGLLFHPAGKGMYILLLTTMCWGIGGVLLSICGCMFFVSSMSWFYASVSYAGDIHRLMGSIDATYQANMSVTRESLRFSITDWTRLMREATEGRPSGSNQPNRWTNLRSYVSWWRSRPTITLDDIAENVTTEQTRLL